MRPALSVLLPVRDAVEHLDASLRSLWRQSFPDFEVVAVDDGSRDGSGELLERAAAREPRLRVVRTRQRGLPSALNRALRLARADVVARHDADDLSHRARFRLQLEALRQRPGVAVLGCRVRLFPTGAAGEGMRRYARWQNGLLEHEEMAREALVESPLTHATAMMRRAALERVGGWRERGWAEDVDLWLRLFADGARFAKLPRALYAWRQHPRSATRADPRYAAARFLELRLHHLRRGILARAGAGGVSLVGTGASGERWRDALEGLGPVRYAPLKRPPPGGRLAALEPPLVLVFGAPEARERWRRALEARRLSELRDFVFVA